VNDLASLIPWLDDLIAGVPDIVRYAFADMRRHHGTPENLPSAVSLMVRMDDGIMDGISGGPTHVYFGEYTRVNGLIDDLEAAVVRRIEAEGHRARGIPASRMENGERFTAAFSHKQAATQAGLGWIGRNCQLVSREFGPRVRLGTVFTDMSCNVGFGIAVTKSFCGKCDVCVRACPAGALSGKLWSPETPRREIFDAIACNTWKNGNYAHLADGAKGLCGICTSLCPRGKAGRAGTRSRRGRGGGDSA
jgi:epoxyqueuosine reductase QueG